MIDRAARDEVISAFEAYLDDRIPGRMSLPARRSSHSHRSGGFDSLSLDS